MARIRTIKPEFWIDEKVVELTPWARLLFIALWNFADDQGFVDHKPKRIKMQIFPGDSVEVEPLIAELITQGLVLTYDSPIGPLLHITKWFRHQRVDKPAKPRVDVTELVATSRGTISEPSPNPPEDSPNLPGVLAPEGKGKEGKGKEGSNNTSELAPRPPDTTNDRPDVERLCEHLADRIEANGSKRPTITKRWRDAARLLIDADGKTEQQVHDCIDWCQNHEFWRANVLSMPKLRDKYDQLSLQAQRPGASSGVIPIDRRQQATNDKYDRAMQRAAAREEGTL